MSSEPFTWTGSNPDTRRGGYRETVVRTHRRDRHTSLMMMAGKATKGFARFIGVRQVLLLAIAAFVFVVLLASGALGCTASASIEPITHTPAETVLERPGSPPTVAPAPVILVEKSAMWTVLDDVLGLLAQYRRGEITIRQAMTWVQERRRQESPVAETQGVAGGEATAMNAARPPAQQSAEVRGVQARSDDAFDVLPGGE